MHVDVGGSGLRAHRDLLSAVEDVARGTGVDTARFWASLGDIVRDLAPRNAELLARRNALQTQIDRLGNELNTQLDRFAAEGLRGGGYGAPAKATTLMHQFGIDGTRVGFIVDDSPWKQDLFSPGLG